MPAPSRNATIALAAGGTGGHLFPAEALARELQRRGRAVVIYTERRGAQYAKALEGIPHVVLQARSLAGGVGGKLAAAFVIARATLQARRDMKPRGVARKRVVQGKSVSARVAFEGRRSIKTQQNTETDHVTYLNTRHTTTT